MKINRKHSHLDIKKNPMIFLCFIFFIILIVFQNCGRFDVDKMILPSEDGANANIKERAIPLLVPKRKNPLGSKKIMIIPVRTGDNRQPTYNEGDIRNSIIGKQEGTINSFFKRELAQQIQFNDVVFAPLVDIPQKCIVDPIINGVQPWDLGKKIVQEDPGRYGEIEDYFSFVILFPNRGYCSGVIGLGVSNAILIYHIYDLETFISVLAHELGHNFGLGHSGLISLKKDFNLSDGICFPQNGCDYQSKNIAIDYGDKSTFMSSGKSPLRALSSHKEEVGVLLDENVIDGHVEYGNDKVFRIYSRDESIALGLVQLIKIPLEFGFYLFSRGRSFMSLEYEDHADDLNHYHGVQIRYISDVGGGTNLVSGFLPNGNQVKPRTLVSIGDSFRDLVNNTQVQLVSTGNQSGKPYVDVRVSKIYPNGAPEIPKVNFKIISAEPLGCSSLYVKFQAPENDKDNTVVVYYNYFLRDSTYGRVESVACRNPMISHGNNIWGCVLENPKDKEIISFDKEAVLEIRGPKMQHAIVLPFKTECFK